MSIQPNPYQKLIDDTTEQIGKVEAEAAQLKAALKEKRAELRSLKKSLKALPGQNKKASASKEISA